MCHLTDSGGQAGTVAGYPNVDVCEVQASSLGGGYSLVAPARLKRMVEQGDGCHPPGNAGAKALLSSWQRQRCKNVKGSSL